VCLQGLLRLDLQVPARQLDLAVPIDVCVCVCVLQQAVHNVSKAGLQPACTVPPGIISQITLNGEEGKKMTMLLMFEIGKKEEKKRARNV